MPRGRFCPSATEQSWVVVPGMYGTHYKHNPLASSVFNNNLDLLIYGCMCVRTLGYKPRYMGRTSNNNKMLINNSLCCFTIRIVYTQITLTKGIRYIDEGFLIWIIPLTYLSYEAVNWACTAGFAYIRYYQFYRFYWFLWCFLSLGNHSGYMNSGYSDVRYIWYIYEDFLI